MSQTITAIATPLGTGAVSIIRLSGDHALAIADKLFRTPKLDSFKNAVPNVLYLGKFDCDGFSDQCLAVYFKAPHSFTGEDLVEFQCHGGVRLAQEILRTLIENGATIATKGEFTKRAFLNGKMTLSEAEGIIDMITGENIASLNAGYRMLSGHLNNVVNAINDKILDLTASLEASLDYPEELEEEVLSSLEDNLRDIHQDLKNILKTATVGRIIKNGINIAIIGEPNIGKSSLLNSILGRDRAIVTDIAGTTRDTLEERVEVDGIFLNFIDTAGIRKTTDVIEKIGVEKAYDSAKAADLILFVTESNRLHNDFEKALLEKFADKKIIKIYNKSDLGVDSRNTDGYIISALERQNIDKLLTDIVAMFTLGQMEASHDILTNIRHIKAIEIALENIKTAEAATGDTLTECILIDLKTAYNALGEITGDTANEKIIDRVFSKFCLGK